VIGLGAEGAGSDWVAVSKDSYFLQAEDDIFIVRVKAAKVVIRVSLGSHHKV
jgi:hypothetical protein